MWACRLGQLPKTLINKGLGSFFHRGERREERRPNHHLLVLCLLLPVGLRGARRASKPSRRHPAHRKRGRDQLRPVSIKATNNQGKTDCFRRRNVGSRLGRVVCQVSSVGRHIADARRTPFSSFFVGHVRGRRCRVGLTAGGGFARLLYRGVARRKLQGGFAVREIYCLHQSGGETGGLQWEGKWQRLRLPCSGPAVRGACRQQDSD